MIIKQFGADVLDAYRSTLDLFFDSDTGAVYEPGREDGTPRFLFTEVTGYAILDFLLLHRLTADASYQARVAKAAEWIRRSAQDETGGVLTRYYFEHDVRPDLADKSFKGRRIYAFDTAICLRGVVAAYTAQADPATLTSAVRMGDFLLDRMMTDSGEVHAIYDAAAGAPVPPSADVWSRRFGAFHTKVAEALIDLYQVTADDRYRRAAVTICENALRFQTPRGSFETSAGRTELHPHCYATEGLLHVGRSLRQQRFIDAAHQATVWALGHCVDGEIPQSFDSSTDEGLTRFRTDALAQVLALGSDLLQMGLLAHSYADRLDDLATKLLSMRTGGTGYYRYGFYEREFGGKLESDTRSYWTQMFCLRGLSKYYISGLLRHTYVAILAGGIGSRVWPISCETRPKPVSYSMLGDRSLLQETIRRYTHDWFVSPERIVILCSPHALRQASEQAAAEGVPRDNCVLEQEPKGTIPAVRLALDGIGRESDPDRLVIVSMADNAITPYAAFQSAVISALFAAREHDCVVSVGKPFDKQGAIDHRFGHIAYGARLGGYRAFQAVRFVEKPNDDEYRALREHEGGLAWECGTVVFPERYYRELTPSKAAKGNLAEHLLTQAVPWRQASPDHPRVATALLDAATRFEDFGVPGHNLQRYFANHPVYDAGNGNVCIGKSGNVRMLHCTSCLVIADELPIDLYGLEDFLVIDDAVTNTAVIMPLSDVAHLPGLYRLFAGSAKYEPFVRGGPEARVAGATTFVEKSPSAHAASTFGLVFAYNFPDPLRIRRGADRLQIVNEACPSLEPRDFDNLLSRQREDRRLAQHLIQVGAFAKVLLGGDIVLSTSARRVLDKLCLYHAYGGCLDPQAEEHEARALERFRRISWLDRRLLDSSIIEEMVRLDAPDLGSDDGLLINSNVHSAVQLLRMRGVDDPALRDVVVMLVQAQDSPSLYLAFKESISGRDDFALKNEIDTVFACFKAAQILSNGRWLWKRQRRAASRGFLQNDRGTIEDFPFILAFLIGWLESAGIEPRPYVERLTDLWCDDGSPLIALVRKIQGGDVALVCDEAYRALRSGASADDLRSIVEQGIEEAASSEDQRYQLAQILELPKTLERILPHNGRITADAVALARETVLDLYHEQHRRVRPHVAPDRIAALLGSGLTA